MKRWFPNWTTALLSVVVFLLPWQTRWMYAETTIAGAHTEFGVMSVYGVEILCVFALIGGRLLDGVPWTIAKQHQLPIRLGGVAVVALVLGTAFVDRSLFSLSMVVHFALAYLLFAAIVLDHVSTRHLLFAFVASLAAPMLLGMVQVFEGSSPAASWFGLAFRDAAQLGDAVFTVNGERVLRAYGSFPHPNIFGGFLGVGLFAWWAAMANVKRSWTNRVRLIVTSIGTVVLIGGMIMTGSRSAFLGVLVGLLLIFVVKSIQNMNIARPLVFMFGGIAVIGSLISSFYLTDLALSIRGGGVNEERSLTERVALYEDFVPFIMATNPIIGRGFGAYVLSFSDVQPGKNAFDYQPIHNVLLLIFAETGILGLFAVLCWFANSVSLNFSRFPHRDALYAFGMANVILMISFFDHYLWSSWSGLALIAFVLGMMVRMGEERGK